MTSRYTHTERFCCFMLPPPRKHVDTEAFSPPQKLKMEIDSIMADVLTFESAEEK